MAEPKEVKPVEAPAPVAEKPERAPEPGDAVWFFSLTDKGKLVQLHAVVASSDGVNCNLSVLESDGSFSIKHAAPFAVAPSPGVWCARKSK